MPSRGLALMLVITAAFGVGACTTGSDDAAKVPRRGVPQGKVLDALGCDRTERGHYMAGLAARFEREIGRDCYRNDEFIARVHMLKSPNFTEESVKELNIARYGPQVPDRSAEPCWRPPVLVRGPDWIVVALDQRRARELRRLVGGALVPPPAEMGPLVSYDLPCSTQ